MYTARGCRFAPYVKGRICKIPTRTYFTDARVAPLRVTHAAERAEQGWGILPVTLHANAYLLEGKFAEGVAVPGPERVERPNKQIMRRRACFAPLKRHSHLAQKRIRVGVLLTDLGTVPRSSLRMYE